MLDIQLLRNDLAGVAQRLARRGFKLDTAHFEALEAQRKAVQTETQELQAKRNQLSKQIGQLKAKKEDASALMAQVNAQADRLKALEQRAGRRSRAGSTEFLRGAAQPAARERAGRRVGRGQPGSAPGRRAAQVRFPGEGPRRRRRRARAWISTRRASSPARASS